MQATFRRYSLALAAVLVAAAARFALVPLLGHRYGYTFFLMSTFVAGRYLGLGPSLVALGTGAIPAIVLHFLPPDQQFDNSFRIATILYFAFGGIIAALCHSAFRVRRTLEQEIAHRRSVEAALRDSRQQLLLAIDAAELGTWQLDIQTERVTWNDRMEALHGFPPGGFQGTLTDSLKNMHPEDRAPIRQDAETGNSQRRVYRVLLPDGGLRWIDGIGKTLFDDHNRPRQMLGICYDVTEQHEAELALRRAEEKFRVLATHAPVGIFQADPQGVIVFANAAGAEIANITPGELLGKSCRDLVHPDDWSLAVGEWSAAIETGTSYRGEFRLLDARRGPRWVIGSAAALRDAAGAIYGHVGTVLDVTERKQAEDVVRVNEARLRGVLDNTLAVVYLRDAQGRYLMVNRRWEELFDLTNDQIAGRTPAELFSPAEAEQFAGTDASVIESRLAQYGEETVQQPDGKHTYLTVKFPIIAADGAVVGVGGMSTDITDRKRALEAIEHEQELLRHTIELQDHERQLITYEIHDGLVQYATAALLQVECLRNEVTAEELSARLENIVSILQKTVAEGRQVINGIRTPVLDDWGVVPAVEQLIADEERAHCHVEFVKDDQLGRLPANIEEALYRITQEALTNVHKHSHAPRARVELTRRGDRIHLEVRDWGIGFAATNGSRHVHGLGGMTNRARIAGGHCEIHSQPGEGTQIVVELPYVRKAAPSAE